MIPSDSPGHDGPPPAAAWCADVAAALAGASARAAGLAVAIADDWRDERGQEWAERTTLLHRELGRVAAEAADLGAAFHHGPPDGSGPLGAAEVSEPLLAADGSEPLRAADVPGSLRAAVLGAAALARRGGPRLGSTTGARTDTDLGMRIAELPPP